MTEKPEPTPEPKDEERQPETESEKDKPKPLSDDDKEQLEKLLSDETLVALVKSKIMEGAKDELVKKVRWEMRWQRILEGVVVAIAVFFGWTGYSGVKASYETAIAGMDDKIGVEFDERRTNIDKLGEDLRVQQRITSLQANTVDKMQQDMQTQSSQLVGIQRKLQEQTTTVSISQREIKTLSDSTQQTVKAVKEFLDSDDWKTTRIALFIKGLVDKSGNEDSNDPLQILLKQMASTDANLKAIIIHQKTMDAYTSYTISNLANFYRDFYKSYVEGKGHEWNATMVGDMRLHAKNCESSQQQFAVEMNSE